MPGSQQHTRSVPIRSAGRVALIYLIFAILWIYIGDALVLRLFDQPVLITQYQTYKGLFFVIISAALIFFLVRRILLAAERDQQALQHSEQRFRSYIEHANDIFYVISVDGQLTYISPNWQHFIGEPAAAAIGRSIADYVHPDDISRCWEVLHQIQNSSERIGEVEYRVRHCDGSWRWHLSKGSAMSANNGAVISFVGIARDVTDRKEMELELQRQEELLRSTQRLAQIGGWEWNVAEQSMLWTEETYHIHEFDPVASGVAGAEIIDRSIACYLPEDRPVIRGAFERCLSRGEPYDLEFRFVTATGRHRWVQTIAEPVFAEGRVIRVVGNIIDITERKLTTAELQHKNAEMEHFLYTVSHDLRSPVITVKSFLALLAQDIAAGDEAQIATDIGYINGATDKMEQLLDALLQLSRIGRKDSPPETLSLRHLIDDTLALLAGPLQQQQIAVRIAVTTRLLHGDPLRLGQIWQNLIENAIKYMGDQPLPQIEIGEEQQGDEMVFYVRDNGVGIAPEHGERIFHLFAQLDPAKPGSGLGLALVKKIVERNGGRIWFESAGSGQGSCFCFTLPQALAPAVLQE